MGTLLNAAKYLATSRDFTLIYTEDSMFDDPIVSASQSDTFAAINLLSCIALGRSTDFLNVRQATDWLNQKSRAANV